MPAPSSCTSVLSCEKESDVPSSLLLASVVSFPLPTFAPASGSSHSESVRSREEGQVMASMTWLRPSAARSLRRRYFSPFWK